MEERIHPDNTQRGAPDVFTIADLLIARALATASEEIDIIGYYGSYAQGLAKDSSDLDIFYIPADGKNPPIGRTVLVDGRLFDFWGIGWDTMEGFATGQKRGWSFAPAIVHHAKVLHARSAVQANRFAALKQTVLDLQTAAAQPQMLQRALAEFTAVLAHLGNLRLALASNDISDIRHAGWKLILSAVECLALANQVFFDRGWSHILEDIPRLRSRPQDMAASIISISTSADLGIIANAAEHLALGTRQILREFQMALHSDQTAAAVFEHSYPEIKDGIRKVLVACERQQPVAAGVAAWSIQNELSLMLNALHTSSDHPSFNLYSEFAAPYRQLGFPDLMQVPATDSNRLSEQAQILDQQLRQWLQTQSVELCEFATIDQFKHLA